MIIDAWMQHPNAAWIGNPMFDSLRRWRPGKWSETAPPIEHTLAGECIAGLDHLSLGAEAQSATAELNAARQNQEQAKQKLSQLEEDFHRSGAPAGWAR